MAKNFFFSFFILILISDFSGLFAAKKPLSDVIFPQNTEECNAPPPDSFHITDAGAHFVSLAWQPISAGASHTLVVLKKNDDSNAWEPVDTMPNVIGDTFTVNNLLYGSRYRFALSTNCANGDPSNLQTYTGPTSGLILDLVLNGRTPINPTVVNPPCSAIQFQNYNWVGFKIESGQDLASIGNFFEFAIGDNGVPLIKRVSYGPHLVAASLEGHYPLNPPAPSTINLSSWDFQILRVDGASPTNVGTLRVIYDPTANPKTVKICKTGPFWSPGYSLKVLTAQSANGMRPLVTVDRQEVLNPKIEKFAVENPVISDLNIFPLEKLPLQSEVIVYLLNINGQIVLKQHFASVGTIPRIPIHHLPTGTYILQIDNGFEIQTLKVQKL